MAKSLKLKNNKYWDGNNIIIDRTILPTYLNNTFLKRNGESHTYTVYGKTGADASNGYRLIFSCKIGIWGHVREVYQIASRHLGTGFYIVECSLTSTLKDYSASIKFYGGTLSMFSDAMIGYYNPTDGMFRVFMHYGDFTPAYITRFMPFHSVVSGLTYGNLTWYDTIPDGIGNQITLTKV